MAFEIVHNDITQMAVDAIVNAANTGLRQGGGVCGAIFAAAGAAALQADCDKLAPCPVGQAVITPGHQLMAHYVIHTVGPVWQGGQAGEADQLASAYTSALNIAAQHNLKSVAFPLISSGIYGYPKAEALAVATDAITAFLTDHDMQVVLVVFDRQVVAIGEALGAEITHYIDTYYDKAVDPQRSGIGTYQVKADALDEAIASVQAPLTDLNEAATVWKQASPKGRTLEDILDDLDETFSERLLGLIDEKGMDDVSVYKRANMSRKLFSKIRSNPDYQPSKATVLALAVALECTMEETNDLLERAGFALSMGRKSDVILRYFIEHGDYNIYTINQALFTFDQPLLAQ